VCSTRPALARAERASYDYAVAGNYTRFSFDPLKRFLQVLLQQGRVQLDADADETYTLLRRILLFVERSIDDALQWVGFEPNDGRPKRRRRHP
jgi:hypothetical protein